MNFLRYHLARFMWWVQCFRRWHILYHLCHWPYHGGRHFDWMPCRCEDCGWRGPLRWTFHTYRACGDDDTEPSDECPVCFSEVVTDPT